MIHTLAERIAVSLFDENDRYPTEVYIYGIELMISSLIGMLLVLLLGILSGYLTESIVFMVSLSAIRFFSGGYHADTYLKCNIIFILSYFVTIAAYRYLTFCPYLYVYLISGILLLFSAVLFLAFAPVENGNKKIEEGKRKKFKLISISMAVFELLIADLLYYFGFIQALAVLPTVFVVDIAMLAEIILKKRRKCRNEKVQKGC